MVTTSVDQTARIWDARTGKPLSPPVPLGGPGTSVEVTPDGSYAVVGGLKDTLTVLRLNDPHQGTELDLDGLRGWAEILSGQRIEDGRGVANLTAEEWLERWRGFRRSQPDYGKRELSDPQSWHLREAAAHEAAGRWSTAVWHLGRLIEAKPDQGELRSRRGHAFAELERWPQAALDFAKAVELGEDDVRAWYRHALGCLATGDHAGYRRACANLISRPDRPGFDTVDRICILGPEAVEDYGALVRQLERQVEVAPKQCTFLHRLGALHYRAGRFKEAVERLNQASAVCATKGSAEDWLFLAMAHQRLGHAEEARRWLARAAQMIDARIPNAPTEAPRGSTQGKYLNVERDLLRREAEALLKEQGRGRAKKE